MNLEKIVLVENSIKVYDRNGNIIMQYPLSKEDITLLEGSYLLNNNIPLRDRDVKNYVSKIIINDDKKVVVIETPKGKFKTTCDKEDYYDPFVGFCIAFTSSFFGKAKLKKWFEKRLTKLPYKNGNKIIEL